MPLPRQIGAACAGLATTGCLKVVHTHCIDTRKLTIEIHWLSFVLVLQPAAVFSPTIVKKTEIAHTRPLNVGRVLPMVWGWVHHSTHFDRLWDRTRRLA